MLSYFSHTPHYAEEEPHAFDLTWKNYIPSPSQLCCCFHTGIRLEDNDPLIEPPYYNDHTLYRGEALQNYLDNPRDWEFESVLGNDISFVTRNPFGTSSIKKKKSHKKKKRERPVVMETDMEDMGYDIIDQNYQHDAEYVGDDQIHSLAYNRNSQQNMDQYGGESYLNKRGPIEQEMRPHLYAARTMPAEYSASSSQPLIHDNPIISDNVTEKLNYIRTFIQPSDTAVECTQSISDIDSVASEALDVYENTQYNEEEEEEEQARGRYSSGDEFHIQTLASNTPFVSDQHPFTYFDEQDSQSKRKSGVLSVFSIGRKWLGV
ncbi:hypothetical protein BDB01DRAFT_805506 [Pilobolus umbonatus]|nr:hypothetical protein BDB01DRAFT_805506 [Pilobolus umbonatus]